MSVLTQFSGGRKIAAITNYCSAGGVSVLDLPYSSPKYINAKKSLSGALTANTLATALSITGRGVLNFAAVCTEDATSRTVRIKVTIDGTSIFDATSSTVAGVGSGLVAVGFYQWIATNFSASYQPIRFYSSCLVQIASSLSETDKISALVNYEVDA